jgi:hypothetical protein
MREIIGGGSYLSASDHRLYFGLGAASEATELFVLFIFFLIKSGGLR